VGGMAPATLPACEATAGSERWETGARLPRTAPKRGAWRSGTPGKSRRAAVCPRLLCGEPGRGPAAFPHAARSGEEVAAEVRSLCFFLLSRFSSKECQLPLFFRSRQLTRTSRTLHELGNEKMFQWPFPRRRLHLCRAPAVSWEPADEEWCYGTSLLSRAWSSPLLEKRTEFSLKHPTRELALPTEPCVWGEGMPPQTTTVFQKVVEGPHRWWSLVLSPCCRPAFRASDVSGAGGRAGRSVFVIPAGLKNSSARSVLRCCWDWTQWALK